MKELLTTNDVRRELSACGAVRPGRRAVEMIAIPIQSDGKTTLWELQLPSKVIKSAVHKCNGLKGEESYTTFREALLRSLSQYSRAT